MTRRKSAPTSQDARETAPEAVRPQGAKRGLDRPPDEISSGFLASIAANKYRAKRTWVEPLQRWFASKREAEAALALWARQEAGEIRCLVFQHPFGLAVNGQKIGSYVADFTYEEREDHGPGVALWRLVVADAKGFPTPVWKLKKKLMKAIHGIEVEEI